VLSPGSHSVDWDEYPLHPQPDYSSGSAVDDLLGMPLSAARAGDLLQLAVTPFSDNVPGHLGGGEVQGQTQAATYQVDQNGKPVATGDWTGTTSQLAVPPVTLASGASAIAFTLNATSSGSLYKLSTGTQTTWTWTSAPDLSATVPPPWSCQTASGASTRSCAVQPMMTLGYQVKGLALDGAAPAGAQQVSLHVGQIQLASAASITGATAQVSCDAGKTWTKAAVRPAGGGNFTVTFSEPGGCLVTTRVTARDSAGASITETIDNAYKIG
jgi:hypothetical protein